MKRTLLSDPRRPAMAHDPRCSLLARALAAQAPARRSPAWLAAEPGQQRRLRADARAAAWRASGCRCTGPGSSRRALRFRAGLRRLRPRGRLAAEHGIRDHALRLRLAGMGRRPQPIDLPVATAWQRWAWAHVPARRGRPLRALRLLLGGTPGSCPSCRSAAGRSGTRRTSSPSPSSPRPGRATRRCCAISGRVLHAIDPGAKVILGGLFGRPLQIPPNVASGDFLTRLYRAGNVKPFFDGVALHPYVADAGGDAGPDPQPAADHARPPRRPHADLHDRARLGLRQLRVALGARPRAARRRELNEAMSMLVANRQRVADRRRLVVLLGGPQRLLPVLRLGRAADDRPRSEARLVPLQRLDRGRPGHRPRAATRRQDGTAPAALRGLTRPPARVVVSDTDDLEECR